MPPTRRTALHPPSTAPRGVLWRKAKNLPKKEKFLAAFKQATRSEDTKTPPFPIRAVFRAQDTNSLLYFSHNKVILVI
jgi:hypothetical protein